MLVVDLAAILLLTDCQTIVFAWHFLLKFASADFDSAVYYLFTQLHRLEAIFEAF